VLVEKHILAVSCVKIQRGHGPLASLAGALAQLVKNTSVIQKMSAIPIAEYCMFLLLFLLLL